VTDLREFLQRFVVPLVSGGDLHVSAPVPPAALVAWETQLGEVTPELVEVDAARAAIAAALVVAPPPMAFDAADLRLAVALHAALVLAHPATDGWGSRKGRKELAAFAAELAAVPPPDGRRELLARHTLLGRMFELVRVDVHVKWWTGKAEFRGAEPPRRLTRWRKLRRVKEETAEVGLSEVLSGEETRSVVAALLAASPLTDLLSLDAPGRRWPPFRWGAQLDVLRDAELARAVAYRWLAELPATSAPRLRACAIGAGAWEQCLATPLELLPRARGAPAGGPPPSPAAEAVVKLGPLLALPARPAPSLTGADVRAATAFLVHLNALCALAEADSGPADTLDAPSPLVASSLAARRGPELAQPEATGLRLFFCVPDVAARCDPALAAPPGISSEPRLSRRWAAHRAQVRAALGEERLAQLARRLLVCL
jgi:hypothetical protein